MEKKVCLPISNIHFKPMNPEQKLLSITNILKRWAKAGNGRAFPWRETANPYNIFVAEVLLQQTFAKKVVPVYYKIIDKHPTVEDLASASSLELQTIIRPLGLLYRANVLIDASIQVVENYGGEFPQTQDLLKDIKGIGDYISAAILCFSFNKKIVPVDTNVKRVISRLFGCDCSNRTVKTDRVVLEVCQKISSSEEEVSTFSYALLDFAAKVCKHYSPACESCALLALCGYNPPSPGLTLKNG